jgi:hypothetical protein
MSGCLPNSSLSHPIRSMISSSAGSFPAGKSVGNGSPPGMRCCAGSRAHRKTIHSPRPSNAVIGMSSPPPSNPARRRSRKGKRRLPCLLPYYIWKAFPIPVTSAPRAGLINRRHTSLLFCQLTSLTVRGRRCQNHNHQECSGSTCRER